MEATAPLNQRLRRFVFTLNNWTETEYNWLTTTWTTSNKAPSWMVIAKEIAPTTGTPHLQGACCLPYQITVNGLKKFVGFKRASMRRMNGSPQQSLVYCSKEDQTPFVFGEMPKPGKRSDVTEATHAIMEGQRLHEMLDEHAPVIAKYHKGLIYVSSLVRIANNTPRSRPNVFWFFGPSGKGKTYTAELFGRVIGTAAGVWISSGGLRWFDGYDGQKTAVFDDFRPKHCKFDYLLRLLDVYPIRVEYKGGFTDWFPEVIFITTPLSIRDTFECRMQHRPEDLFQLRRRVTAEVNFADTKSIRDFVTEWWPDGKAGYVHDRLANPPLPKTKPQRIVPITVPDSPVQSPRGSASSEEEGQTQPTQPLASGDPVSNGEVQTNVRGGGCDKSLVDDRLKLLRERRGLNKFSLQPASIVRGNLRGFAIDLTNEDET